MKDIELKEIKCECGWNAWVQAVSFGYVPAVLSESGKAGLAPVKSSFVCAQCGTNIENTAEFKEMMAGETPSKIVKP